MPFSNSFCDPLYVLLGKRRIRVHTLCLPVVSQLSDVYAGADVQAITCLLANMGECVCISLSHTHTQYLFMGPDFSISMNSH